MAARRVVHESPWPAATRVVPARARTVLAIASLAWALVLPPGQAARAAEAEEAGPDADPARLAVTGLGWIENLQMKAVLRQLRPAKAAPVTYDANAIEDGAFLLLHHVQRLGYLRAAVHSELILDSGEPVTITWRENDLAPLPRPLAAREVRYRVEPGLRYYYEDLQFRGLTALAPDVARRFFIRSDGLLQTRSLLRFSRTEFDEARRALETSLAAEGHAEARVSVASLDIDHDTAAVRAVVRVDEGPLFRVRALNLVIRDVAEGEVLTEEHREVNQVLTRLLREDLEQESLVTWFREGYPDATATATLTTVPSETPNERLVDLRLEVLRGPRVKLGEVRWEGPEAARAGDRLRRRVRIEGPWLYRLEVDEARAKLARLGGFRFVNVDYAPSPSDPEARDPVFELQPGRRLTADLLAGFRSYELLYGGVQVVRRNLFNAGHSADLRLVQSFKSTEASATYSIPDAFAEDLTVFALVDLLTREEVSFRREEFRTGLGARRSFEGSGQQIGARYNFELLRAVDAPSGVPNQAGFDDEDQPVVSSVVLDWTLERRDSALAPRRGFQLGATVEVATPEFGGEARFIRPEFDASFHVPLRRGRFLHAGLRYSLVTDPNDEGLVPFNKRLLPGGEDSVRGYQRGEASPLNALGEVIGAESALVWNLEFEQLLTPSWSVVAFVDGVAASPDLRDTVVDEVLWSAGAGIRWNTAIGPVRLEYGHNLNPRDADPSGTVHFSVGFPF